MGAPKKTVRVLFVVRSLHVGGMEQMVIALAASLPPLNYQVRFCTIEDAGQLAGELANTNIELDALNKPPGLHLGYVLKLRKLIDGWQPDIIHTHNDTGHFYAALANVGLRNRPKLVHTKHGRGDPDDRKSVIRNCLASRLSDAVIAVSNDVAKVCRDVENVPQRKIRTIINGIDLQPYLTMEPRRPTSDQVVFGHVGRLSQVKNQTLLIKAFKKVHDQLPKSKLLIAGDGPMRAKLEATAKELGVASSVTFFGYRADIANVLNECDAFVLSSVSEGTPLVVIEAMASGRPVIATDVGGLSDMFEDGASGLLVPTEDDQKLSQAMLDLAQDPGRREEIGMRGRAIAVANYGLARMVRDYCGVYEALLTAS